LVSADVLGDERGFSICFGWWHALRIGLAVFRLQKLCSGGDLLSHRSLIFIRAELFGDHDRFVFICKTFQLQKEALFSRQRVRHT
jgi:hypothetical protein